MDLNNKKSVSPLWFGLTPYDVALERQKEVWSVAREKNHGFILGLEHPTVVTLGKRGDVAKDLRMNPASKAVEVVQVDRGGQGTLHSPGQLVIYPIIPIQSWQIPIREFVGALQLAVEQWLKTLGIVAMQAQDEPGIYTHQGKIGFVGLRVERGITRHGIAINVCNDLSLFSLIRSCGKESETFDSLERYGIKRDLKDLFAEWTHQFCERLDLTVEPISD